MSIWPFHEGMGEGIDLQKFKMELLAHGLRRTAFTYKELQLALTADGYASQIGLLADWQAAVKVQRCLVTAANRQMCRKLWVRDVVAMLCIQVRVGVGDVWRQLLSEGKASESRGRQVVSGPGRSRKTQPPFAKVKGCELGYI